MKPTTLKTKYLCGDPRLSLLRTQTSRMTDKTEEAVHAHPMTIPYMFVVIVDATLKVHIVIWDVRISFMVMSQNPATYGERVTAGTNKRIAIT